MYEFIVGMTFLRQRNTRIRINFEKKLNEGWVFMNYEFVTDLSCLLSQDHLFKTLLSRTAG